MIYILSTLAGVSIVLFTLSFFMNDRFKQLDNQLEQVSISSIQEIYLLKKKIKVLEEELLTEDLNQNWEDLSFSSKEKQSALLKNIEELHGHKPKAPSQGIPFSLHNKHSSRSTKK